MSRPIENSFLKMTDPYANLYSSITNRSSGIAPVYKSYAFASMSGQTPKTYVDEKCV